MENKAPYTPDAPTDFADRLADVENRATFYAGQVRHWKARAEAAEDRVRKLEAQINAPAAPPPGRLADLETAVNGLRRRVELIEARHADHDAGLADIAARAGSY